MKPARVTVAALILAGIFGSSIGAGYMIGQGAFRHSTSFQAPAPPSAVPVFPATGTTPSTGRAARPRDRTAAGGGGSASDTTAPPQDAGTPPSQAATAPVRPEAPAGPSAVPGLSPVPGTPAGPGPSTGSPPAVAPGPTSTPLVPQLPSRFHVQVGAFDARQNAEALALRIKSLGYAVTLVEGPQFRVWVGGYLDRATAEQLAEHLRAAGFEAALTPR